MTMVEQAPVILPDIIEEPITITPDRDVMIVEKARNLLRDKPHRHTTGAVGRDAYGHECHVADAFQVCAIGALYLYGVPQNWPIGREAEWARQLVSVLGTFSKNLYRHPTIVAVNDEVGRLAAIKVFDAYLMWRTEHGPEESPPGHINLTDVFPSF